MTVARTPVEGPADSLQLLAAVVVCDHRPQAWEFVCLDERLRAAAEREGFKVVSNFA